MVSHKPKVLVAMSGGVDSSVAAALLLREGYDVVGCFMRLGSPGETLDELVEAPADDRTEEDGGRFLNNRACGARTESRPLKIGHQGCCSINDAADARLVASQLGIPFYVVNFKKDFGRIIDYFVGEYNAGRTPNPCVRCNDWLKFGKLHEYANQIDAEFVASGHYARIERSGETSQLRLLRGIDHNKDQSYVLFGAPRERLSEMLLPIGGMQKPLVRELAQKFDLPVFDKPDSQEICFVPDNDYAGLVARQTPQAVRAGAVVDRTGKVIGEHSGHQHFTIGQRKGVGIALGHPVYVVAKNPADNTITVGEKEELYRSKCVANESNWLVEMPKQAGSCSSQSIELSDWMVCTAKIRYNSPPTSARVRMLGEPHERMIEVEFDEPQLAVAPGQAVVCYDGEVVLCGGWISSAE